MKTQVKETSNKSVSIYPRLFKCIDKDDETMHGTIILAENNNSGTVIHTAGYYKVGHYSSDWIRFDNPNEWQPLEPGSQVILEQE